MLPHRVKRTFRSLRHRNYRLWFFGQTFSLFGTWMQITAQAFLVYQLTNSPAYLGLVGFAAGIPALLLTPYGGAIADRSSRKRILLATQIAMMALAFILAALTLTGTITPPQIILLAFLLGIANAFDAPARQAFTLDMVDDREDLGNAISLNGTMVNLALVAGPAIAGITYALFGPAMCFILNAISFLAVIIALLMMNIPHLVRVPRKASIMSDLKEGLKYTMAHGEVSGILWATAITSIFGMAFITIIPAWAVKMIDVPPWVANILGGDASSRGAQMNGILQSARGIGALAVALWTASMAHSWSKGRLLAIGAFATPLFLIAFAYIHSLWLALAFLIFLGGVNLLTVNMAMNLLQSLTTDNFRGRVMGLMSLVFFGLQPVGALWIGWFSEYFGEQTAVVFSASVCLIATGVLFWASASMRKLN